jgi:hypothetical protein
MNLLCRKVHSRSLFAPILFLVLIMFSLASVKAVQAFNLTLTNTKTGSGDINGTINCTLGSTSQCITSVIDGTDMTLAANPDWKSIFEGWGPPCSGTGSCIFTLNADIEVSAAFSPNFQAKVLGMNMPEYATLTDAYADADEGDTVSAHVYTFMENLTLGRPVFIKLSGGKGDMYLSTVGFTTLSGTLELQQGSAEIDSIIIQ